jgi:hypothetical protein
MVLQGEIVRMQAFQHLEKKGYKGTLFAGDACCLPTRPPSGARPASTRSPSKAASVPSRPATSRPARKEKKAHQQSSSTTSEGGCEVGDMVRPSWWSSAQQSPLHVVNDQPLGPRIWLDDFEAKVCSP